MRVGASSKHQMWPCELCLKPVTSKVGKICHKPSCASRHTSHRLYMGSCCLDFVIDKGRHPILGFHILPSKVASDAPNFVHLAQLWKVKLGCRPLVLETFLEANAIVRCISKTMTHFASFDLVENQSHWRCPRYWSQSQSWLVSISISMKRKPNWITNYEIFFSKCHIGVTHRCMFIIRT